MGDFTWHHAAIDDKQLRAQSYGETYRADYGFEATMVRVRQRSTLAHLPSEAGLVVVEVGCGTDLLVERTSPARQFARWVIDEPSPAFAGAARDQVAHDTRVQVVEAFFEDAASEIRAACGRSPDVVICSSLLHEVADPQALLLVAADLLGPNGQVIVNVPNAGSLHRRLAVAMGLIDSATDLSARNTQLRQPRVLDAHGLEGMLTAAGFRIAQRGGYFIKPFTHTQMTEIPFLDDDIIAGLERLGAEVPDLASEIYAVARLGRDH